MIKTKSTSSPLQGLRYHGSTTSDVRISFLWYQIPAVATASIRMQSFCVSPDTATTTCHTTEINGHYYYIKDGDTIWNPGWMPSKTELDSYECRHGMGYSVFTGVKNGLMAQLTDFVPMGSTCEINKLTLKNTSDKKKDFSVFSYVEFCLWNAMDDMTNFQRNFSTGEVEIHAGGSQLFHKTEYRERRNHYAVYAVNASVDGFDTDRDSFLGAYGENSAPSVVVNDQSKNSVASGWAPVGSHHLKVALEPGEEKTYIFVLGYVENPVNEKWVGRAEDGIINRAPADALLARFDTTEKADAALAELKAYWDKLLGHFTIASSEEKLDRMVNVWHQYQCMVTFNMSRSASYFESGIGRGMGFRDSCQDLLGFVHLIPDRARERILDIAATQFEDGSAYHQYQPLTKKGNADIGFNDAPLWLIAAAAAYIKETGDYSILDESTPYDSDPSKATDFMEHLRRSFNYTINHLGPHGLPQIGRADWNDCLNLNCFSEEPGESFQTFGPSEGPNAESVFIAGMFVKYGKDYVKICRHKGLCDEADTAQKAIEQMEKTVMDAGWDGEWYLRAYDHYKHKIGSKECEDGKIFIEPQGFCVIAEIGKDEGFCLKAMQSVEKYLDTKYGIVLLQPPYHRYHVELGEISSYPPGYKENAGIFCHNNPWISIAEAVLGRGDLAFDVYRKICPSYIEEISDVHRTEPYIYSQMVAGADAARFGEAKNSWLTGTAAWTFVNLSQALLGIQPEYDGLAVNPCLPKNFGDLKIKRRYRDAEYYIDIRKPDGVEKGVAWMEVDGEKIAGNQIPLIPGKKEYHVTVQMG